MNSYMKEAIKEAKLGSQKEEGGPFGCIIVKENKIIGRGHSEVLLQNDPTCHGEMMAIRDACRKEKTNDLSGAVLYTTGEPCPMCLGAILWANIDKVYYGCSIEDTNKIGFRDKDFYEYLKTRDENILSLKELEKEECLKLYEQYQEENHKRY